jgi:uncharacterized protein (DUF2141 family)
MLMKSLSHISFRPCVFSAMLVAAALAGGGARAAELVVKVTGLAEPLGQVGCTLFAVPAGFPMDDTGARVMWQPADAEGVVCRFSNLVEGSYAVSIGHDLNGNKKVDTNFLGMPTEQWGVSNNARPLMRAPRFEEATFKVFADSKEIVIEIKVAK